jgi:hypothetical protein
MRAACRRPISRRGTFGSPGWWMSHSASAGRSSRAYGQRDHDRHPLRHALEPVRHELHGRPLARAGQARAAEAERPLRRRPRARLLSESLDLGQVATEPADNGSNPLPHPERRLPRPPFALQGACPRRAPLEGLARARIFSERGASLAPAPKRVTGRAEPAETAEEAQNQGVEDEKDNPVTHVGLPSA